MFSKITCFVFATIIPACCTHEEKATVGNNQGLTHAAPKGSDSSDAAPKGSDASDAAHKGSDASDAAPKGSDTSDATPAGK
jgi:hypothetical protein